MQISANPSTTNNISHCFIARGVKKVSSQKLDRTEDISIVLMDTAQVRTLLVEDEIKQALMAAPLWKYFALEKLL